MGKNQRARQPSSQLKAVNSDRQGKQPAPPSVNPVLGIIGKYPLLFVCGLWAGLLAMALAAVTGLADPGHKKGEASPTPTSVAEYNSNQDSQNEGRLPLLLFGAIALTCASGSWIILQQLQSSKPRRPIRRQRPRPRPISQQSTGQGRLPQSSQGQIPAWGTGQQKILPKPSVAESPELDVLPSSRRPEYPDLANLPERMYRRKR
jgi:hypothetical protein